MAGFAAAPDGRKIKGGRWTVARFFLVSVAFTSAWLAVSSQRERAVGQNMLQLVGMVASVEQQPVEACLPEDGSSL